MENNSSNTIGAPYAETLSTPIAKPVQLVAAFFLGVVMLYGAGFVQTSAVHNAAHDVRHTLAFPCH